MVTPRVAGAVAALLALAPGCGHISNAPIEEDSTFLAALPDRARQALVSPDDATASPEGTDNVRVSPIELPWETSSRAARASAARSTSPLAVAAPGETLVPTDLGFAPTTDLDTPDVLPTTGIGQATTPEHDMHAGVPPLERPVARLAPVSQAGEAAAALGAALGEVFDVANAVRGTAPDDAEPGYRGWSDVEWHGHGVAVGIAGEDADFTWEMAAGDAEAFLDGWHQGEPTMETGAGGFTFDRAAWASAFGLTGSGVVEVAYDNRAGVDLDLALTDLTFPDAGSDCASGPTTGALVRLGPSQRYHRDGDDGDYQLVTRRGAGCIDTAESAVRVRWSGALGRADARITFSDGRAWSWTQCWSGGFDAGDLAWEHLTVDAGATAGTVLLDRGDPEACAFADFADVDDDIRGR